MTTIRLGDMTEDADESARAHSITEAFRLADKGWATPEQFGAVVEALTGAGLHIGLTYSDNFPASKQKAPASARDCLTEDERHQNESHTVDGVYLFTDDAQRIAEMTLNYIESGKPEGRTKLPNLAVHLGPSGLLVADCDTASQVEAFKAASRQSRSGASEKPTVTTPGVQVDGVWKHSEGGHSYFVLPDGVSGRSKKIPIEGSSETWDILGGDGKFVVLPGSTRTEGRYRYNDAPVAVAPSWILNHIAASGEASPRREIRTQHTAAEPSELDAWAREKQWSSLLSAEGWQRTGPSGCGELCSEWMHPTATSSKSAVVHAEGCTGTDFTRGTDGDWPMHLFSTSHPTLSGDKTYTKAQFVVESRYGGSWRRFSREEQLDDYALELTADEYALVGKLGSHPSEAASEEGTEWCPLDPFRAPPPPLPLDGLPTLLRAFVTEAAEALQVPTDLVLNHCLGALSSAPYGTLRCRIRPGWDVPLNLAVMTLAKSGELKSPLNNLVMKPFDRIETDRRDRDREAALDRSAEIAALSTKLDQVKRSLTSSKSSSAVPVAAPASPGGPGYLSSVLASTSAYTEVATLEREITRLKGKFLRWSSVMDDATPEAVGVRLGDTHTGAVLMRSDETNIFSHIAGQARNGGGTEKAKVYLHGVSGDPIRTDRLGRDEVYVERPSLSMALMMQPEVFESTIRSSPQLVDIGIVPRLLIVRPASKLGERKSAPDPMSHATEESWITAISAISRSAEAHVNRVLAARKADAESSGKTEPVRQVEARMMTVNPAGWELLRAYKDRIEPELGKDGRLAPIRSWGSKSTTYIAQIAALLTLLDDPAALEVDNKYIMTAETLMDGYALHHLALAEVPTDAAGEAIWSRVGDLDDNKFDADGFIKLTAVRKLIQNQAWFKNADMRDRDDLLRDALSTLEARGYVKTDRTGRRDSLKIKRRPDTK